MQIELTSDLQAALERRAAEAGMSISSYANLLMQEQLRGDFAASRDRGAAIDALLALAKDSSASSGRAGREWREFIHEGHLE